MNTPALLCVVFAVIFFVTSTAILLPPPLSINLDEPFWVLPCTKNDALIFFNIITGSSALASFIVALKQKKFSK